MHDEKDKKFPALFWDPKEFDTPTEIPLTKLGAGIVPDAVIKDAKGGEDLKVFGAFNPDGKHGFGPSPVESFMHGKPDKHFANALKILKGLEDDGLSTLKNKGILPEMNLSVGIDPTSKAPIVSVSLVGEEPPTVGSPTGNCKYKKLVEFKMAFDGKKLVCTKKGGVLKNEKVDCLACPHYKEAEP